jgi:hypothetical protein
VTNRIATVLRSFMCGAPVGNGQAYRRSGGRGVLFLDPTGLTRRTTGVTLIREISI